jgi:hypothetical protein
MRDIVAKWLVELGRFITNREILLLEKDDAAIVHSRAGAMLVWPEIYGPDSRTDRGVPKPLVELMGAFLLLSSDMHGGGELAMLRGKLWEYMLSDIARPCENSDCITSHPVWPSASRLPSPSSSKHLQLLSNADEE